MVKLGLFDIMQIDPLDPAVHAEVYRRRLDLLAQADDLGFEVAFVAERHYQQYYRTPAPSLWLAAAAQRTQRIRLGVLAYTLPLHPPALLAEEIAVLDHLSGGRLEVGLGLGHRVEELNANGIDPAQRVTIFQERLAVLEGLLSGGQVTFESEHSVLRNLAINPLPLQQPFPPLWYAGTDPTAATWAGSRGMSLAIGFAPVKALLPTVVGFEAGRERRGHSAEPRTERIGAGRISLMQHVYIAENDDRAFAEMRSDLERMRAVTQQHQESSETERKAAAHADVDHLLASGVFLAGGPERVAEGILHARKELGVDLFLANPFAGGVEDERVLRTLSYLQGDVRQALDHAATQA